MKKAIGFTIMLLLACSLFAADWSSWEELVEKDGIQLEFRAKHYSDSTSIQWRVTNSTDSEAFMVSVRNIKYIYSDGRYVTSSDVGDGLRPGKTYTFVADTVNGNVTQVSAGLRVQWKP
jgi:hypothetical protein